MASEFPELLESAVRRSVGATPKVDAGALGPGNGDGSWSVGTNCDDVAGGGAADETGGDGTNVVTGGGASEVADAASDKAGGAGGDTAGSAEVAGAGTDETGVGAACSDVVAGGLGAGCVTEVAPPAGSEGAEGAGGSAGGAVVATGSAGAVGWMVGCSAVGELLSTLPPPAGDGKEVAPGAGPAEVAGGSAGPWLAWVAAPPAVSVAWRPSRPWPLWLSNGAEEAVWC